MANRPKPNAQGVGNTPLVRNKKHEIKPISSIDSAVRAAQERLKHRPEALRVFNEAGMELKDLLWPSMIQDLEAMATFWESYQEADEEVRLRGLVLIEDMSEKRYPNPAVKIKKDSYDAFVRIKKEYGLTLDSKIRLNLNVAATGSLLENQNDRLAANIVKAMLSHNG